MNVLNSLNCQEEKSKESYGKEFFKVATNLAFVFVATLSVLQSLFAQEEEDKLAERNPMRCRGGCGNHKQAIFS
ncbi:MAG: hypothetical protein Kow0090_19700 [Myxococcota bacterium]